MSSKLRTAVLVVGMHRSGSSALTRVVNLLGAAAARTLKPADESNPRGFWESERIVHIHDAMLTAMGSSWADWRPSDQNWLESPASLQFAEELRRAITEEF